MAEDLQDISDSFIDLERHRLRLEENVTKLQKSLQHWQTWAAEYEGFKEELLALGGDCTDAELSSTGAQYEGTLLNEKEIELLLKDNKGQPRGRSQVVGLLDRRIDYVEKNINTIEASLRNAEEKAAASLVLSQPDIRNEDGLPLTEIREELDEEGNVISSSITNPNETAPHVVEALRKAGVSGLPETKVSGGDQDNASGKKTAVKQATKIGEKKSEVTTSKLSKAIKLGSTGGHQHVDSQSADKPTIQRKKSVSFAEGTKKEDATTSKRQGLPLRPRQNGPGPRNKNSGAFSPKPIPPTSSTIANGTGEMGAKLDPNQGPILEAGGNLKAPKTEPFSAIVPSEEPPRDAELRREMIEYNMRDIGSVVAEIDLEEEGYEPWLEGGEAEDDEEDEDEDDNYGDEEEYSEHGSSTDEDEDEFGRSKRRVLDDKYLKEMRALEKKLNSMTLRNIGPESRASKSVKVDLENEEVDRIEQNDAHQDAKIRPTKEVRFASKLDIQESPSPATSQIFDKHGDKGETRPFKSSISERAPSGESSKSLESTKKVSRFKNGRNGLSAEDPKLRNCPAATLPGSASKAPIISIGTESSLLKSTSTPAVAPTPLSSPQTPSGPHAAKIIERPYSSTSTTAPPEPDDLDPVLLQQQVATEYRNMRNRMIQRQGGFLASAAEEANDGAVELEEGGERKVSRFKAAKLRMGRESG